MKDEKVIDLSDLTNPNYKKFFSSRARDVFVYGSAAAGKSYSCALKLIVKCLKYPERRVVIIRKFSPSLRLTCFHLVSKILDTKEIPHWRNNTDMRILFSNGSEMFFLPVVTSGGEPAERIKSLTDITDIWIEEATELSYDEFLQVKRRLRGGNLKNCYPQRIYSFNPVDSNHWLKTRCYDRGLGEWLHFTYKDNPYLSDEEKQDLENLKYEDETQYKIYALGEWATHQALVYSSNWEVQEFRDIPTNEIIFAGVDFGFENPSVFLLLAKEERKIYIVDEVYKRRLTNKDFIREIENKMNEWKLDKRKIPVYCDSSEPARLKEMEQAGFLVYPAKGSVVEGINIVLSHRLIIHPRCINTIKEIQGYKRREDRNGNILEEPVKFNDHAMDALRYAVSSVVPFKKRRLYVATI